MALNFSFDPFFDSNFYAGVDTGMFEDHSAEILILVPFWKCRIKSGLQTHEKILVVRFLEAIDNSYFKENER